jgi:hypothetical protein
MAVPNLVLDPSLKYWALLPISIAMVLFGLVRQQLNVLLSPARRLPDLDNKYKQAETVRKVALFKTHYWNLPVSSIHSRQSQLVEMLTNGSLLPAEAPAKPKQKEGDDDDDDEQQELPQAVSTDAMMHMVKNQFGNMAAQYVMMGWVNYFFAGFVLMKLPFPLTFKFKQMLQSGVLTADLDVRWVSSISWYFIAMLGLNSVYNLLVADGGDIASQMMQQQQMQQQMPQQAMPGIGGGAGGGGAEGERKQFESQLIKESNDVRIIPGTSVLDGIEERLLKMYA